MEPADQDSDTVLSPVVGAFRVGAPGVVSGVAERSAERLPSPTELTALTL